jgi:hypothetical protein
LTKLLHGKNLGLARSAREALEHIAKHDDSRQVSQAAEQALGYVLQTGSLRIQDETDAAPPPLAQKDESPTIETDEPASLSGREVLMTLGWAIAGAVGGASYNSLNEFMGGAVGGAIGGFITAIVFQNRTERSQARIPLPVVLAWALGGLIGWAIGEFLTEVTGMAIGFAIGASLSVSILVRIGFIPFNWKSIAWIVLAWTIGSGIGWFIAKTLLIEQMGIDFAYSWMIGMAIGWAITGFVMGWQLSKHKNKQKS